MLTKLLAVLIIVLVACVVLRLYMPRFGNPVATGFTQPNGVSVLGDCPDMPNCQCSEASRESQRVERFIINGDPAIAMQKIIGILSSQPGARLVKQDDRYTHFTFTSAIMRFVDDVELLISDDLQSVQIRSASRLGKSDLGANVKRVEALRGLLTGQL